ncbi:Hypothetical protein GbCGDNIH3_7059 [Granulibacter bethesdensis]|uniref:Uncharacterized protein n=1 Tax=Granulibacter bethesdensis TaxID=364410 RepID=A0AAN0RE89_9PROT|nr:hypothetical protein [Granulibacter bethesdensis]AHJ63249.1 Hypothetical protein GbCGDNIH3_7059 [Granulibacter bethesdensis]
MARVIRRRNCVAAVGIETTQGVDVFGGSPSASTDFLRAEVDIAFNQNQVQNPEFTGSLDASPALPGGTRVTVTLTCLLKGSGSVSTAPQWGKLMRACGFLETVNAGIAAAVASDGDQTSFIPGSGFSKTDNVYLGQPFLLSLPGSAMDALTVANSSGGTGLVVPSQNYPGFVKGTTTAALLPNITYRPIVDPDAIPSLTIYVYMDGIRYKFTGARGNMTLDMQTAGIGTLKFTMNAQYSPSDQAPIPSGIVFDAPQPPIFRNGIARAGRKQIRIARFSFDGGLTVVNPDNPEAGEGFDPAEITVRASTGSIDPLMSITDTAVRIADFKAGNRTSIAIGTGSVAGNMFGITVPAAQFTGVTFQNRNDLMAESYNFGCTGSNLGVILCQY